MGFDGTNKAAEGQGISGTATISVSGLASNGLADVAVSFPATLPSAPRVVHVEFAGFATASSTSVIKGAWHITTTGFDVIVLNLGASPATFTNLPISYVYWL